MKILTLPITVCFVDHVVGLPGVPINGLGVQISNFETYAMTTPSARSTRPVK